MKGSGHTERTIGLFGATSVGVGAIVGGGIMVLAGVAFENAGPAALVAFALNGLIALVTAMSFAEMSSRFPQSGGAYTFATKVLSVRAAFAVGWVLWFAYIVAGVLYALGFAAFAIEGASRTCALLDMTPPRWLVGWKALLVLATAATATYALSLIRKSGGGGQYATIGKVVVFAVLIGAGLVALVQQPASDTRSALSPFFAGGGSGLLLAMGFTFIALQGFDLVAAIAAEVKEPARNIPRAMFLSLGCALVIYLPLLLLLTVLGVGPGGSIAELAAREGDTVFATAVSRYMGSAGYWLVIVAAILSTLSALHANILAASRVAFSMANDRTLPGALGELHVDRKTPVLAICATALAMLAILIMIPNVAAAGAAAGFIFAISFTLAHVTSYLARVRGGGRTDVYQTPWFPLVPIAGGSACAALAVFQAIMVPAAAGIVVVWLGLGALVYFSLLRRKAETADASAEALDPDLVKLRGKRPLVLLPVANPAHARALIGVANAVAPTAYARVLLLTVVTLRDEREDSGASIERLHNAQRVVSEALTASYAAGASPEALITTAADPWKEIERVAQEHDCASLLLGLRHVAHDSTVLESEVERLINRIDCDVAIMRAPQDWRLDAAERILVPVGGRGEEHELRARVLGSLCRIKDREVTFVTVVPADATDTFAAERRRNIRALAEIKIKGKPRVEVVRSDDPASALIEASSDHDLIVLGLKSVGWGRKVFGEISLRIARDAHCATIMLSGARSRSFTEIYRPLRQAVSGLKSR